MHYCIPEFWLVEIYDSSFGVNGEAFGNIPYSEADAVAIDTAAKIIVAGSGAAFYAQRFLKNGHLDKSFGSNGKVKASDGLADHAESIALQTDGKIVLEALQPMAGIPLILICLDINMMELLIVVLELMVSSKQMLHIMNLVNQLEYRETGKY